MPAQRFEDDRTGVSVPAEPVRAGAEQVAHPFAPLSPSTQDQHPAQVRPWPVRTIPRGTAADAAAIRRTGHADWF
ncbi:MAG: hypothetical protein FWF02_12505 [Micrococcales bacterium]|nr:hypothetical protein [Micrococcales bacterium]MCL2668498.1 hypothetical protein [Micrococcales bacterium]